ncbi:MAG: serine/threonine-protein kinase [Pseudanabaenaceae cyanobacterium bins.68]|nr:serine/threonine-protein kinase [Pseudanabaenaceae cyanobacterium bins.68]
MAAKVLDGRYKLIKALGAGGFGRTFLAKDMRRPGNPTCVVKQLKPASTDPGFIREARRLFNTEAETLEKLGRHDQIPQLLAYFEEDQQFFLVQEYIEGHSLHSELKSEPKAPLGSSDLPTQPPDLPPLPQIPQDQPNSEKTPKRGKQIPEVQAIANLRDILQVLEFVHSEGVIHRDIKPDNLIRRRQDQKLVLIDFGAVKAMQDGAQLETAPDGQSRFTVTIGTPGYMASEQCAGRPNFTSDLYSVGMVMIKSLTGFEPTDLPTDPATGELIWRDQSKISNGLAMVLTRMVRYHYKQRYQSVKEVQQALNAFLIEPEVEPQAAIAAKTKASARTNSKTVAKSQTQSNAGVEWLIGGMLLIVIALAAFTLWGRNREPQQASNDGENLLQAMRELKNAKNAKTQPAPESPKPDLPETPKPLYKSLTPSPDNPFKEAGELQPNQPIFFTFPGRTGLRLQANLSAIQAKISVLDQNQQPVDANAKGVSSWSGDLAERVYQIELVAPVADAFQLNLTFEDTTQPTRTIEIR